uniref:Protein kinase domain-containing protein n=1 Tax=Cyprinodon variegatus TaxID=28743 RepID=A0A3Q2FLL3_CYPVA
MDIITDFWGLYVNYCFKKYLGSGVSAVVTQCIKQETGETVAIKIAHRSYNPYLNIEKTNLITLKELGSDNQSIIKFYEDFYFRGHRCLVFEMLELTLDDFLEKVVGGGLHLNDIRVITQQLLVALDFLHGVGMAHRDIKPDNIMLVDRYSLKVKFIDMGFAEKKEYLRTTHCSPLSFRPLEEFLLGPLDVSVDVWSLACTLAFLYLGDTLFPGENENDTLSAIFKIVGCPDSLDELLEIRKLLKQMLNPTPSRRITAADALKHSFITMEHLSDYDSNNPYVCDANEKMRTYGSKTPIDPSRKTTVKEDTLDVSSPKQSPSSGSYHGVGERSQNTAHFSGQQEKIPTRTKVQDEEIQTALPQKNDKSQESYMLLADSRREQRHGSRTIPTEETVEQQASTKLMVTKELKIRVVIVEIRRMHQETAAPQKESSVKCVTNGITLPKYAAQN